MCLLCIEIAKMNMTPKEVARAFIEVSHDDAGHILVELEKLPNYNEIVDEMISIAFEDAPESYDPLDFSENIGGDE